MTGGWALGCPAAQLYGRPAAGPPPSQRGLHDLRPACLYSAPAASPGATRFEDNARLPMGVAVNSNAYSAMVLCQVGAAKQGCMAGRVTGARRLRLRLQAVPFWDRKKRRRAPLGKAPAGHDPPPAAPLHRHPRSWRAARASASRSWRWGRPRAWWCRCVPWLQLSACAAPVHPNRPSAAARLSQQALLRTPHRSPVHPAAGRLGVCRPGRGAELLPAAGPGGLGAAGRWGSTALRALPAYPA